MEQDILKHFMWKTFPMRLLEDQKEDERTILRQIKSKVLRLFGRKLILL